MNEGYYSLFFPGKKSLILSLGEGEPNRRGVVWVWIGSADQIIEYRSKMFGDFLGTLDSRIPGVYFFFGLSCP